MDAYEKVCYNSYQTNAPLTNQCYNSRQRTIDLRSFFKNIFGFVLAALYSIVRVKIPLLSYLSLKHPLRFNTDRIPPRSPHIQLEKIGHGSFGTIFLVLTLPLQLLLLLLLFDAPKQTLKHYPL